ncbi:hypothetical protein Tco_1315181 [Tanacetum coccineum]
MCALPTTIIQHYGPDVEIVLDVSFFINSHLTHLKLSCEFPKPTHTLDNCYGDFLDLNITSNSVKIFEIFGNRKFRVGHPCVTLEAPNILSLTIKGSLVLSPLQVFDVTSLVEANIDYYNEDDTGYDLFVDEEEEMIYRHVKILRRACGNELKLWKMCLEVLSRLEAKGSCTDDYYKDYYKGYIEDWRMSRMEMMMTFNDGTLNSCLS